MNKNELIEAIVEKLQPEVGDKQPKLTKKLVGDIINVALDSISEALEKDDCVQLVGFGSFMIRNTPARTARNPRTGEEIQIKAGKKVTFKVGKGLKDRIA